MRILACGVVWNEIDILPYLLKYLEAQGIDVFIFDNNSTDGTWEYLQDNKIKCERLFSGGKFSLVQFIKKMTAKWHELNPDWCIYLDADEFPLAFQFPTLKRFIEVRDKQGFNVIRQIRVNFRPTGMEDFSLGDPLKIYRYYFINFPDGKGHPQCERIFKYYDDIDVVSSGGHTIERADKRVSIELLDNPIFHYSMRQNAEQKNLQRLERRNKDDETVKLRWNTHYEKLAKTDKWIWDKNKLCDIKDPKDELYDILNDVRVCVRKNYEE